MRSIHDIINVINAQLCEAIRGAAVYGIATAAKRNEQLVPHVDGKYVGVNDAKGSIQVYHKLLGITSQILPGNGYGDSTGDQANTYTLSMIVFHNRKLTKIKDDQLVLIMQANTPRKVRSEFFKAINVTYATANLDGPKIYAQEYGSGEKYPLGPEQNLIQINYSVRAVYKEGCYKEILCKN